MALGTLKPLLDTFAIVLYLSIAGPIGFIYAIVELRIFFWPFLVSLTAVSYLLAEHFDKRKPRRKWKFWEPHRPRDKWGVHHLE